MKWTKREELPEILLPGRFMQKIVGRPESAYFIPSEIMHVGYCRYCGEAGAMTPHMHREETVQILRSDRAWVRYGNSQDDLPNCVELESEMTLHFDPGEWHVFEYAEGGSLEILFIYGNQVQL